MNEAITRGSIARNIVAELLHRKRRAQECLTAECARAGRVSDYSLISLEAEYAEAHNAAETARRILYGLEL
jgi:hypothetical protein